MTSSHTPTPSADPSSAILVLADVNMSRSKVLRRFNKGELIKVHGVQMEDGVEVSNVLPGVYLRSDATPVQRKQAILASAARIGTYIFKSAVLYGDSAVLLGQNKDVLSLASFYDLLRSPMVIGGVLTVKAHRNPDVIGLTVVENALAADPLGEFKVKRFTEDYTFLCGFRKRVDNSTLIPPVSPEIQLRIAMSLLGLKKGGDAAKRNPDLEQRLLTTAGAIKMTTDKKMIPKYLHSLEAQTAEVAKVHELRVFWHDRDVGTLSSDGSSWEFDYLPAVGLKLSLSESTTEATQEVPNFMGAILPENSRSDTESLEDRMELFTGASRFISNISVHPVKDLESVQYVPDVLNARLTEFKADGNEFKGSVAPGMRQTLLDPAMLNSVRHNPAMPRISGMQVKLPCNLDKNGTLDLSVGKSFSHMVKLIGGANEYSSMCSMEWYGLSIAKEVGIMVEDFVIADIGLSTPALIVERFDVRVDYNDKRFILAEDLWSILGLRKNELKYSGDLMDVAKMVMAHSTDKTADATQLIAQSMVSWLIHNSDMHLKNLLMIKETTDPSKGFSSIRLSPAYDMMCTQVFPNDPVSAGIAIGGNRHHSLYGFVKLGEVLGFSSDQVVAMARYVSAKVAMAGATLAENLPPVIARHAKSASDIKISSGLIDERCGKMLDECDAFKLDPVAASVSPASQAPESAEVGSHLEAERRRSSAPMEFTDAAGAGECFDASDVAPAPRRSRSPR